MSSVGSVAAIDNTSFSSTNPQQQQNIISLINACSSGKEDRVRALVTQHDWSSPLERDALRHGLQRVAARGNHKIAQFLLDHGAEINAGKGPELAAVFRAAENGHFEITRMLLQRKASPHATDKFGRTALFAAASKGYIKVLELLIDAGANVNGKDKEGGRPALFAAASKGFIEVLKLLIDAGADVNAKDKEGKTVLIYLASEKLYKWNEDVVRLLLERGVDLEAVDGTKRTVLIEAADHGKFEMVKMLLESKHKANVSASTNRGRNALHFASEKNHENVVAILLDHDADAKIQSDGGWTALHHASEKGHLGVVRRLLAHAAPVNAKLSNGMTALHWAAQNGHKEVVNAIINDPHCKLSIKDSSDRTPMLCAAEHGHRDIVYLLSPGRNGDRLSDAAREACKSFEATVVDFGKQDDESEKNQPLEFERKQRVLKDNSIYDLLYGWGQANDKPKVPSQVNNVRIKPRFRWIHIPANNLAWVDAMLTNAFIESGHREIEDFKALEKCFRQEHRGVQVHATFMRPYCSRIPHMSASKIPMKEPETPNIIQEAAATHDMITPQIRVEAATPMHGSVVTLPEREGTRSDRSDKENATPKGDKKKTKSEKLAERHGKKSMKNEATNGKGTPTKVKGGDRHPHPKPKTAKLPPATPNGKLILFMPFLHYESDESRQKMSDAIKRTYSINHPKIKVPMSPCSDDRLIEAYLGSTPALHARRTLDQFFYHGIDTSKRDKDQVVYRYCKHRKLERKVFMVDQLWMWVLGKDLIITSFPQRWQQPKNDPLNVLDGIIEDINAKTRPPVKSVYDLAMLITSRCSGMFDLHRLDDENYQFIDMFESSIGHVTNKETELFNNFNHASTVAGEWLKSNRIGRGNRRILLGKSKIKDDDNPDDDGDPIFVDTLLDIGTETKLLTEIKDIRDELNIIRMVLESQKNWLPVLADHMADELGGRRGMEAADLLKRSNNQVKTIEGHIKNLDRMDKQAELNYNSLTHLLDLKQKHANAFEARFARDQAALTARQGQTIMVFTIVTIVFLPMSFIAAFFNINVLEFKRVGDQSQIPLDYVAKYTFGIGMTISIPLIFLAFAVDDVINFFKVIAYNVLRFIPGVRKRFQNREKRVSRDPWARRYSDSKYSVNEKQRRRTETWEAPPRSSFTRELSPLSDRTGRTTLQGNHILWNRPSFEQSRPSEDV